MPRGKGPVERSLRVPIHRDVAFQSPPRAVGFLSSPRVVAFPLSVSSLSNLDFQPSTPLDSHTSRNRPLQTPSNHIHPKNRTSISKQTVSNHVGTHSCSMPFHNPFGITYFQKRGMGEGGVARKPIQGFRLTKNEAAAQFPSASATAFATRSICSGRSSGYIGRDRTSSAARSAAGKSPRLYPSEAYAGCRCSGTG